MDPELELVLVVLVEVFVLVVLDVLVVLVVLADTSLPSESYVGSEELSVELSEPLDVESLEFVVELVESVELPVELVEVPDVTVNGFFPVSWVIAPTVSLATHPSTVMFESVWKYLTANLV